MAFFDNPENLRKLLRRYNNPNKPYSYGSPGAIHRYYKKKGRNVPSIKEIKKALEYSDAYVYHREFHDTQHTNPMYVYERRAHVELDLADMAAYSEENDGVHFLLTAVDGFTRKAWIVPMLRKDAKSALAAIKHLVENEMGDPPKKFVFDHGKSCATQSLISKLTSVGLFLQVKNSSTNQY